MVSKLIELKNVIVTNNSVVIKNFRPVKESVINDFAFTKYQKPAFLFKYIFPTLFKKGGRCYIMASSEWSTNYYYWIHDTLPRLMILHNLYPEAVLIMPKNYLKIDFVVKSLQAFAIKAENLVLINKKSHLSVEDLSFIAHDLYYPSAEQLMAVRQTLLSYFAKDFKLDLGDKIYVSRNNPKFNFIRQVENEDQIIPILRKYGFKIVYMEDYNFVEQMAIASKIKYFIAPHGAGVTNFFFMDFSGKMLELLHKDRGPTDYERVAELLGVNYMKQRCEAKDQSPNAHMSNVIVDPEQLENNIKLILG